MNSVTFYLLRESIYKGGYYFQEPVGLKKKMNCTSKEKDWSIGIILDRETPVHERYVRKRLKDSVRKL